MNIAALYNYDQRLLDASFFDAKPAWPWAC